MATVNYSVPEEIKAAFNEIFAGRNKSAIIAGMMMRAVQEEQLRKRRVRVMDGILELRDSMPRVTDEEVEAARHEDRP